MSTVDVSGELVRESDESNLKYVVARNLVVLGCAAFWCAVATVLIRYL